MKIDRFIKDISDRLDGISPISYPENDNDDYSRLQKYDDEYYLDTNSEPPRFAYYRHVRVEQCTDEYRKKSLECVHDSITQDELDYYLKAKLRVPPEQRYQDKNTTGFFRLLSSSRVRFAEY